MSCGKGQYFVDTFLVTGVILVFPGKNNFLFIFSRINKPLNYAVGVIGLGKLVVKLHQELLGTKLFRDF